MADKKLNEVSQLTDFDYALVVKGNDVAKVTKQQLATILGGLLEINKYLKPIDISSYTDINDIVQTGIYGINIGVHPLDNVPVGYGLGITINSDQSAGGMYPCVQFMVRINNEFYIRFRNSGTWNDWRKL